MKPKEEKPTPKKASTKVSTKASTKAPNNKKFDIASLFTLQSLTIVTVFLFLIFVATQVISLNNKVEAIVTLAPQEMQEQVYTDQEPLNTRVPYLPTATHYVIDPFKTPITYNYEEFVYTTFEIKNRGGSPLLACPYRWISVRDAPTINSNVVGCLPPYSKWNVEVRVDGSSVLVREENGSVWGVLAMQPDHWIALKYCSATSCTEFTNWHEK